MKGRKESLSVCGRNKKEEVKKISYDPYIICKKEGCNSHDCELHHIVPKFKGGVDTDGRVYLCTKHHKILGLIIPSIIFKFLKTYQKEECKLEIKEYTNKWLKKNG